MYPGLGLNSGQLVLFRPGIETRGKWGVGAGKSKIISVLGFPGKGLNILIYL